MTDLRRAAAFLRSSAPKLQLLCLLMAGGLEFLMVIMGNMFGYVSYYLLHSCIMIPCVLFWGITLLETYGQRPRYPIGFAVAMVVWFLIVELLHRVQGMNSHTMGLFAAVYLLAFPFAAVTQDEKRQLGMKVMTLVFAAASAILLLYAGLLMTDHLPGFLQEGVHWDGARLHAAVHPNISSRVFMIALAFCLCVCAVSKKKWVKALMLAAVALMFFAMALTNSRAAVLTTCLIVGGTVFFAVFRGGWKRFFAGAAVGLVALAGLFLLSQEIFEWNSDRLIAKAVSQQSQMQASAAEEKADVPEKEQSAEEAAGENLGGDNKQGSLLNDLTSLNSRTYIWSGVFQGIRQNPAVLLWGADGSDKVITTVRVDHAHNAWLETLVRLGLPGLVLSLVFTAQAVWSAACLMWYPHVGLEKKIISMLALSLLVSGVLEPFLFFSEDSWHFVDFVFFLCLGYMNQWRKGIHIKESRREEAVV